MGATGNINTQYASVLLDANEANPSSENGGFTDWAIGSEFILCVVINYYDPCNKATNAAQIKVQFAEDGGAWTDVATGQAIAPGSNTTLVNGNSVAQRITSNVPSAYCASGFSTVGKEVEGTNTSSAITIATQNWTEVQFALDPALANSGSTYTFRLYNVTDGVALPYGTIQSSVAIASTAVDVAATTDSLLLTENAATVKIDADVQAGYDALAMTEQPATVALDVGVSAGATALTITENAASISYDVTVQAQSDGLVLSTLAATVEVSGSTEVSASVVGLSLTAYQAGINAETSIQAGVDNLTVATHQGTVFITEDVAVSATCANLLLTETAASINAETSIAAGFDSLNLTAHAAGISTEITVEVAAAIDALVLSSYPANINAGINVPAWMAALSLSEKKCGVRVSSASSSHNPAAAMML